MNLTMLKQMLSYRRPAWSKTEEAFIKSFIDPIPGVYSDGFGNRLLVHPSSKVIISCHTDTVHNLEGMQVVAQEDEWLSLPNKTRSNCLGADDTAGVFAALQMIKAGVPATYIFHRAEEIGGRGSRWLAERHGDWLSGYDICLALDRRGTSDIITSQSVGDTASDEFAESLANELAMGHSANWGTFTDSANYSKFIPECSNLSIGYENEHSRAECLNVEYLEQVIDALIKVNWDALTIARDPNEPTNYHPIVGNPKLLGSSRFNPWLMDGYGTKQDRTDDDDRDYWEAVMSVQDRRFNSRVGAFLDAEEEKEVVIDGVSKS